MIVVEPEEYIPESGTAPAPEPAPEPEPEAPAAPVEVITVEDLLDRITGETGENSETEEPTQETEGDAGTEAPAESGEALPAETPESPIAVAGMDKLLKYTKTLQETADHPMLTTPFEDYTVAEGLLLLLLLSVFVSACVKLLKGGFAWLR